MVNEQRQFNQVQLVIGIIVLLLGSSIYLLDRPIRGLPFLRDYFSQIPVIPPFLSKIGQVFPAFSHTLGFTLLTVGVLSAGRFGAIVAASFWLVINLAFEFGQHPSVAPWIVRMLSEHHEGNILRESMGSFLQSGTFDLRDVAAILLGAGLAYFIAWVTIERRKP